MKNRAGGLSKTTADERVVEESRSQLCIGATTHRVWVFRLDNGGSRSVPSPALDENMS
jgi:hypothetical protein